eukprot:CAMPEP_0115870790 /NCGR_PEP_ID=MMETSP0287-20121206/22520_1 /TAXON_ID=412157 /ORGANISM="Chrysochromulina rotalis, Strain UIO044" /LENGTH=30 /DNA_ID= /DNA_START= /DNA_END= /DNA_ORIENTATION=
MAIAMVHIKVQDGNSAHAVLSLRMRNAHHQ